MAIIWITTEGGIMGLSDIDKSGEFADTRSDQREHKTMLDHRSQTFRAIGYAEGTLKQIAEIAERPGADKVALAVRMETIAVIARKALDKLGEV